MIISSVVQHVTLFVIYSRAHVPWQPRWREPVKSSRQKRCPTEVTRANTHKKKEREEADASNSQWQRRNEINAAHTRPWTLVFFMWFVQYAIQCKKIFFFPNALSTRHTAAFSAPPKEPWHFIYWRFKKTKQKKPRQSLERSWDVAKVLVLTCFGPHHWLRPWTIWTPPWRKAFFSGILVALELSTVE